MFQNFHTLKKIVKSGKRSFLVHIMSSEESDGDDAIKVSPLPWRSNRVSSSCIFWMKKSKDIKSP